MLIFVLSMSDSITQGEHDTCVFVGLTYFTRHNGL